MFKAKSARRAGCVCDRTLISLSDGGAWGFWVTVLGIVQLNSDGV